MLPHDSGAVVDDDGGAHDVHRAEADQHHVGDEGRVGRVIRTDCAERNQPQGFPHSKIFVW